MLLRPLYGSRNVPLKWWLKISGALRSGGYRQIRSDPCTFAKHRSLRSGEPIPFADGRVALIALLIIHVDDIFTCGLAEGGTKFIQILSQFRYEDVHDLKKGTEMVFCGITSVRLPSGGVVSHQQEYAQQITPMSKGELFRDGKLIASEQMIRTDGKTVLGSDVAAFTNSFRYDLYC